MKWQKRRDARRTQGRRAAPGASGGRAGNAEVDRIRQEESRRLAPLLEHAREHGRVDSLEDVERALQLDVIFLDRVRR